MGSTSENVQQQSHTAPTTLFAKATPGSGGVSWSLGAQNPPASGKAVVDVPKGDPGREIIIHLVATHGLDIAFDTGDPVWATETGQCPPLQGIDTDQLEVVNCTDRKLTLFDSNSRKCVITYQMNFVGAPPFDPEIRNGGRV